MTRIVLPLQQDQHEKRGVRQRGDWDVTRDSPANEGNTIYKPSLLELDLNLRCNNGIFVSSHGLAICDFDFVTHLQ